MKITKYKKEIQKQASRAILLCFSHNFLSAGNDRLSVIRNAEMKDEALNSCSFDESVSYSGTLQLKSGPLVLHKDDSRDLRLGNSLFNFKISRLGEDEIQFMKKVRGGSMQSLEIVGSTLILGSNIPMNYFHWMCDVLGDFYFVKEMGFDPFEFKEVAVPSIDKEWQKEVVEILGLRSVVSYGDLQGKKASVTVPVRIKGRVNPLPVWQVRAIEQVLNFTEVEEDAGDANSILYVSRASATRRRLVDEACLLDEMSRFVFKCVDLDGLSVKEQAVLFRNAKVVVGIHGAGLTNLAFCREGAQVVELFPPGKKTACFANFAYEKKLVYQAVWGCERITGMGAGLEDFRLGSQGVQDVIETISRYLDGPKG